MIGVDEAGWPPCRAMKSSASSVWSGVFSANSSTPLRLRLAIPVSVPAGGSSSRPVTPRSAIAAMHRSQRTGEATWPTRRRRTSRPSWTTCPSRFDNSRVRGSWVEIARERWASRSTAGSMWTVWKAPATLSGIEPRPGRRVLGEGGELLDRPRGDDLAGAVVVGGGEALRLEGGGDLVRLAADDRGHRGRTGGAGRGHGAATFGDEDHRRLGGEDAHARGGGDLADGVAGGDADQRVRVRRVREQLERREQPGGHQQRLRDRGVPDGLGVGVDAVVLEVEPAHRAQPGQAVGEGGLFDPRAQEPGGLCALTGRDDRQHPFTLS